MSPRRVIGKKIGELLIERHVITADQLHIALAEQRKKGGYISQHLISLGFANEFDIANCLSNQYGFAYLPLSNYSVPVELLDIIPLKLIKIYRILPIDKIGNVLTVTMADPLNDGVIEMLRQITQCEIQPFISTYSELKSAIDKYFGRRLLELDNHEERERSALKEEMLEQFIQTSSYKGKERRRYKRLFVDLEGEFCLQGKNFKAQVKNLSYVGLLFVCDVPIAAEENIVFKIKMGDVTVDSIVQIIRAERMSIAQEHDSYYANTWVYGVAGFFNFVSEEDENKLAGLLNGLHQRQK